MIMNIYNILRQKTTSHLSVLAASQAEGWQAFVNLYVRVVGKLATASETVTKEHLQHYPLGWVNNSSNGIIT